MVTVGTWFTYGSACKVRGINVMKDNNETRPYHHRSHCFGYATHLKFKVAMLLPDCLEIEERAP